MAISVQNDPSSCVFRKLTEFFGNIPLKTTASATSLQEGVVYKKLMLPFQVRKERISQNFTNEDPKTQRSLNDPYLGG